MPNEDKALEPRLAFLEELPSISLPAGGRSIGRSVDAEGRWWVKFTRDTNDHLAWRVVQELGHVLNYLSHRAAAPVSFMPVSSPPYMNGGVEFLSWVVESKDTESTPASCAEWLEGRLPRRVTDLDEGTSTTMGVAA